MILVIDKSKNAATNLADAFHTMGIPSNAVTPSDARGEVSDIYRAIVITSADSIPDLSEYISTLRRYAPKIPMFSVGEVKDDYSDLFCKVFCRGTYAAEIVSRMTDACIEYGYPPPAHYTLAGIDASPANGESTLFGDPLPFTKTENMIIRCLIRSYPTEMPAEDILVYAYRRDRMPEAPNVRTHVSSINKKFELITGRPLITTSYGKGYILITPEIAEARRELLKV